MPLNRKDKQAVVAEVVEQVKKCQTVVLAEYRGISSNNLTILRTKAREQDVYLRVLKNTLVRRAVEGTPFSLLADYMTGPLIYSISKDAIAAAKVINDFLSSDDKLSIKAGLFDGKVMSKDDVKELASIQSREKLLSTLLFVIQAPVFAFGRALIAILKKEKKAEVT
ncbi:MAG: 50S ribosomal protein L10 [Burkholderia sp.]|nr:50S ribosomal protein L10 [Burkholderia sp.]